MIKTHRSIPSDTIKLVVFDLDGTLIDSRLDLANSVNAMLSHFGRPELPCDIIAGYIGDGAPMLIRRALGDPDDAGYMREALEYFLQYYREHKLDNTHLYKGIREALTALRFGRDGASRSTERALAVLSNKPVNPSRQIVEALGIADFFFQVYGGNSFPTKKPDPLGVNTLLQEASVRREEALMIGDSEIDVLTARNAGMWSCGVTYGFAPHTLVAAPPDLLVDKPEELAGILEKR